MILVARKLRYYLTEILLWLLAGAGLIAILLVIAAYTFNTSVILFRTGSMEPTVPTGSAALVREIPAAEVEVGDILTVERPEQLPVTHRVISIEPGDSPEERVITMQGDANDYPDASPYTIAEGKVLLGSVPGMASIINQLGNPYVLGGITVAASLLVGWAFWPRKERSSQPEKREDQDTGSKSQRQTVTSASSRHHSWVLIAVLTIAATAVPSNAHASAANLVEQHITSQYITLISVFDPASRTALAPGNASLWDIGIDVEAPSEGQGSIGLQAQGDFPLEVSVLACAERWTDLPTAAAQSSDSCSTGSRTIVEDLIVAPSGGLHWIEDFETTVAPWFRLVVSLPSNDFGELIGTTGLRVDVKAAGDEVSTDTEVAPGETELPTPPLPLETGLARTGTSILFLLVVALASMGLGRWLYARRVKRYRDRESIAND